MGESGRFLIVEDEAYLCRTLARLVRPFGEPVVAGTATEAMKLVASASSWRAFLIDLGLPDGPGMDVLRAARRAFPDTPAMVLTGHMEAELINTVHDLGAHYVVKPFDSLRIQRFCEAATSGGKEHGASSRKAAPIPTTLEGCIERLRELLPLRLDPLVRYTMGTILAAIKANPDAYGPGAVSAIASTLGQDLPSLYRHAAVAERWTESEMQALLARTGQGGRPLSWSHIVLLGSLASPVARARLVEMVLDEGLSVRQLTALVDQELAAEGRNDGE